MITKLTVIKHFWTYHQVTIINDGQLITLSMSESELKRIQKRSKKQNLYSRPASFAARLIMGIRIILGR